MNHSQTLLVTPDDRLRDQICGWLDEEGLRDLMLCPGPSAPDYTCIAGRGGGCPLLGGTDVVVVDLCLRSDDNWAGITGTQLMHYYIDQGKCVVAISHPFNWSHEIPNERLRIIAAPVRRDALVEAIRSFRWPAVVGA